MYEIFFLSVLSFQEFRKKFRFRFFPFKLFSFKLQNCKFVELYLAIFLLDCVLHISGFYTTSGSQRSFTWIQARAFFLYILREQGQIQSVAAIAWVTSEFTNCWETEWNFRHSFKSLFLILHNFAFWNFFRKSAIPAISMFVIVHIYCFRSYLSRG